MRVGLAGSYPGTSKVVANVPMLRWIDALLATPGMVVITPSLQVRTNPPLSTDTLLGALKSPPAKRKPATPDPLPLHKPEHCAHLIGAVLTEYWVHMSCVANPWFARNVMDERTDSAVFARNYGTTMDNFRRAVMWILAGPVIKCECTPLVRPCYPTDIWLLTLAQNPPATPLEVLAAAIALSRCTKHWNHECTISGMM